MAAIDSMSERLRADALRIWRAGVDAVRAERLIAQWVAVEGDRLRIGDERISLETIDRICVLGAGKASGAMAAAIEAALGPELAAAKRLHGWVNVPADCLPAGAATADIATGATPADGAADHEKELSSAKAPTLRIVLHPGRPPGVNEPTRQGAAGAERILELASALGPRDLCLAVISGGGSALLPAPAPGITLADKLEVTRYLSGAGANIVQLNTVRKQLSRIKGGGLARACRAGRMIVLVISDVPGDPLDVIASGPTVPDPSTADDALGVLDAFAARDAGLPPRVFEYLEEKASRERHARRTAGGETTVAPSPAAAVETPESLHQGHPCDWTTPAGCRVTHLIIGNNARAVDAAGAEAERLGYQHAMISAAGPEGAAEEVGRHLAAMALRMRSQEGPNCLISGGEPVVSLVDRSIRGLGGRNQQAALAAVDALWSDGAAGIVVLSGGTDGEDGPTDAAGAVCDAVAIARAKQLQLDRRDYLRRNDAYTFFRQVDGLIRTGPTHTNVCDVRVVLVARR